MKQYLELVRDVIENGTLQGNRTGVRTISLPGAMLRFDLQKGFPAITTRKLAFKSAIGEMVGFLRGVKNAGEFRELGCKVWDQNANENAQWLANPFRQGDDDLGEIYGVQWRKWPAYKQIPLSNTAAIEQTLSNGYKQIAQGEEDGQARSEEAGRTGRTDRRARGRGGQARIAAAAADPSGHRGGQR